MSGEPIRILELRSVRGTGGGPEKTIFLGASKSDPSRFAVTVCYIRDLRDDVFALDRLASELRVDYVEVLERHSFDRSIWPALCRIIRERRIDIVHAHEHKTDLLALLLARATGVVPLSTAHGWAGHSPRERLLYYPVDRYLLRKFPRVVAVSSEIRDQLIRSGVAGERIVTVLNGIDPDVFCRRSERCAPARAALNLPADATVVGAVGRLEPGKRFDLLIEAVARLRTAGRDLRLVIAGDGSISATLPAIAARFGLGEACLFAGHRPDVVNVLHAFDLFVQSSDHEGTPNAVLEAMAVETPIVATAVGGTCEVIEHGTHGLLVPPGDASALAAAIGVALGDPAAAARRAANGRRRVERELSFSTRMRRIEGIYTELAALRAAPGRPAAAVA